MSSIVAAALSSHAYTFQPPGTWDARRAATRKNYNRRYGREAPEFPNDQIESLNDAETRYRRISDGLAGVRERLNALEPDVLIVIGDDQDENYREDNLPQIALFTGSTFAVTDPKTGSVARCESDPGLARHILTYGVESGFDIASSASFVDDRLMSHAHCEPILYLKSAGRYRVLPVFVNGIHVPAPTPRRCYEFGQMLRRAIDQAPGEKRVALYASGGMSHYSAGFPWMHYSGPNTIGSVSADFDRRVLAAIRSGDGASTAELTSRELLDNGDVEMRQTIVLAGVMGNAKPAFLEYEPFHRGIMGMAVGFWEGSV